MFKILLLTYMMSSSSGYGYPLSVNQIELVTEYKDIQTCQKVVYQIQREFKVNDNHIVEFARCIKVK
jgi:hypothetical protein